MALAIGDVLQFIMTFGQGTNTALMVGYWRVDAMDTPNTYTALAAGFQFELMSGTGQLSNVLATSTASQKIVVNSLTKPLEFGEHVEDINGGMIGDPAPAFVALRVKQSVESKLTRAGYKRIPFVGEAASVGNNVTVGASVKTAIEEFFGIPLNVAFTHPVDGLIDIVLEPIVVGRTLMGTPPVYTPDISKINPVTGASLAFVTSQTSRKAV